MRLKFRIAILIWMTSGSILALGTIYLTEYLLIPLIIITFLIGGYCLSLRCPNCRKPVLHNPVKIFDMELYIWTSSIPSKCSKCGTVLN